MAYVYILTIFLRFIGLFSGFYPSSLLSWMFEHGCLDMCCFRCPIHMCFIIWYLYLFSATEHVSHGKALKK